MVDKIFFVIFKIGLKFYSVSSYFFKMMPSTWQQTIRLAFKKYAYQNIKAQQEKYISNYKSVTFLNGEYLNSFLPKNKESGINLLGFLKSSTGLGHQARSIYYGLSFIKDKVNFIDCGFLLSHNNQESYTEIKISSKFDYCCNLISVNPNQFTPLIESLNYKNFTSRYNIHYCAWELSKYPKEWLSSSNLIHEFWAMSKFVKNSIERSVAVPVILMPYAVDFQIPEPLPRSYFSLPKDNFIFVFSFDFSSIIFRKNPFAIIKAFRRAFSKEIKDVTLLFKISRNRNNNSQTKQYKNFIAECSKDPRIIVIDKIFNSLEVKQLIQTCNCYVSLHRSEGFGIGMAEAMKLGKAVIATNYSGNTDFTTKDTACIVGYDLIDVKENEFIFYETGQKWADPDLEEAVYYMQKVYHDSEFNKMIAHKGKTFIEENYSIKKVAKRFSERLKIIGI